MFRKPSGANAAAATAPPTAGDVPILGQPATIIACMPTTVLTCNCDAKPILVVTGLKNGIKCSACGRILLVQAEIKIAIGVGMEAANGQPAPGIVT